MSAHANLVHAASQSRDVIKALAVCRVIMYLGPEQGHIRDTRSNQRGFA
jgi:hypothetical protein